MRQVVGMTSVPIAAVAVALLAGCGSSATSNGEAAKPARQILDDAATALRHIHSVKVQVIGNIEKHPATYTIAFERPDRASITFERGSQAAVARVVAGAAYMKANASLYEHQAGFPSSAVGLVADRWIKLPQQESFGELFKSFSVEKLSRCLVEEPGTLIVAGEAKVKGHPAVVLVDKGDRPGSTPSKLYVATTGAPLPLRIVATGKERPGGPKDECSEAGEPAAPGDELTFSEYNRPLGITAPAGAIDLSQLGHPLT
jgi:hypothetical protein